MAHASTRYQALKNYFVQLDLWLILLTTNYLDSLCYFDCLSLSKENGISGVNTVSWRAKMVRIEASDIRIGRCGDGFSLKLFLKQVVEKVVSSQYDAALN